MFVRYAAGAVIASLAHAQPFEMLDVAPPDVGPAFSVAGPRPTSGSVVAVDHEQLVRSLAAAPMERPFERLADYGLAIDLPTPGGTLARCRAANSPVMEPALAALHPQIQTYLVTTEDGSAIGRIEVSPRGLTGMLRAVSGKSGDTWMIDPWRSADPTLLIVYRAGDLPAADWTCHTQPDPHVDAAINAVPADTFSTRALQSTRTNRLAMACTGEYGLYHSTIQGHAPNAADPLAAMVTVVGRVNVVYENDLAVHFNLVANNDRIVYFNPDTDPFPSTCDGGSGSDCSGAVLNALGGVLDSNIGTYNAGHCLTRVAGGVAYLPGACGGRGVSGTPRGGDIEPYAAHVVIHELGHQFGASHTFSGTRGRCLNNVSFSSAWEAGSGSSPMAYAGGCPVGNAPPSDNIVQFADFFFHHGSLEQMQSYLLSQSCMSGTPSTNSLPVITSVTPNQAIPPSTPFVLSAVATDADSDLLTYSWEQFDNGASRPLIGDGSQDSGIGALFRIFPPVASTSRTFPQMSDVLSDVPTPGEQLPSVTGAIRRFRAVVRDNRAGMGASVISPLVQLTIASGSSPFRVNSPTEGSTIGPNTASISWSVGNTNAAPINATSVVIRLSTDNGFTFPHTLGTFPNTGSATVSLPPLSTTSARVRIDPVGKIFFAVSRPFTIGNCPADFNADGFLDGFDYDAFVACFEGAACPPGRTADFNGDTFTDGFDYDAFVTAFEQGC